MMAIQLIKQAEKMILRFKRKDIFTMAAAVSFYAFLSLFPLFIVVISLSTLILEKSIIFRKFEESIRVFPPSIAETLTGNLRNILESREVFSVISFLFLVYLAFKVFGKMQYAMNKIYGVEHIPKPWKTQLRTFGIFLITSFMLSMLFIAGGAGLALATKLEKIPLIKPYLILLFTDLTFKLAFFSFSYRYLSSKKLPFKNFIIGGLFTAVLWEILKHIFGIYVANIDRYTIIYGSIGSFILLQLWLYYAILSYLIGAEISVSLGPKKPK